MVTKRCCRCRKERPYNDFHSGQGACKKCNALNVRDWRKRNPDKARAQNRRNKLTARRRKQFESLGWEVPTEQENKKVV